MLRIMGCAALLLIALTTVIADEDKSTDLLAKYQAAEAADKSELREKLVALPTPELHAGIKDYSPEAPTASGVVERETECPDGFKRPYWVYVPENYDATKRYPMVVCLHGSCAGLPLRGTNGGLAPAMWALNYWRNNLPDKWKSEIVLLGCSAGPRETTDDAVWYFKGGEENVLHMISETKRFVSVDDNRVFVSGHSDGGNGSFGFAFRRPEPFAGYLPMCGNFTIPMMDNTPIWWENLKGANIYAFNGKADDLYPADDLTPFYDIGNTAGANIEYKVYDELTHDISPVVGDEVVANLKERIPTWKRDLRVTEIDWTCTDPDRGRRAWLSIDAIADLGEFNKAPENAPLSGNRVRLGVQLTQDDTLTVDSVTEGGAAASAGVKPGDVFTRFDDAELETVQDLVAVLRGKQPGDEFTTTVTRDGESVELKGKFPTAEFGDWNSPNKARVIASWKAGEVTMQVSNAATISIYVFKEMLGKDGTLTVSVNGKQQILGKIEADNEFILDEFTRTADRSLPWLKRLEIDVAKLAE